MLHRAAKHVSRSRIVNGRFVRIASPVKLNTSRPHIRPEAGVAVTLAIFRPSCSIDRKCIVANEIGGGNRRHRQPC